MKEEDLIFFKMIKILYLDAKPINYYNKHVSVISFCFLEKNLGYYVGLGFGHGFFKIGQSE